MWFALPPDARRAWPRCWSCWRACRRTTPSWPPTAAGPRGCWRNARASRPTPSAARARIGTRCGRSGCPQRTWRRRCCPCCRAGKLGRLLDIGTGTGRMLELLAPRVRSGLGVDASRAMLALARARLAKPGLAHLAVRQADMYRLPLSTGLRRRRCCKWCCTTPRTRPPWWRRPRGCWRPGGRLVVVDLAGHSRTDVMGRLAHRWPGFTDAAMQDLLRAPGLVPGRPISVPGPLAVRLWPATLPAGTPAARHAPAATRARTCRTQRTPDDPTPLARCPARPGPAVRRRHGQPRAGADPGHRARLLEPGELHRGPEPVPPGPGARDPPRLLRGRRGHGGDQHLRRLAR